MSKPPNAPKAAAAGGGGGGKRFVKRAGDPAQVSSLISSIKQYKGFRNMANYSLSCLLTHITPPTVGWRENIETAIETGGIEIIVELLKAHPGALDTLKLSSQALSGLVYNEKDAERLAKAGGVETALGAMLGLSKEMAATEDGVEAQNAGSMVLVKVARYNPDAILDSAGGVSAVLEGISKSSNRNVKAACAVVADRVGVSERGQKELLKKGAIPALIKAIAPGTENGEELLKPVFRLLDKFADDKANIAAIRDAGGVEAIVAQLEMHAENEPLLRMGGRLLTKVAQGDLEAVIAKLKKGGLSGKQLEFAIALLANLALQPEGVDRIMEQGGVRVLIQNFDQFNTKTQAAAARAIARIAADKKNAAEVIKEGGIKAMLDALKANPDDAELQTAITQAIAAIATSDPEHAKEVDRQGGIVAVVEGLKRHAGATANSQAAFKMFEQISKQGFSVEKLVSYGTVESILAAMSAGLEDPDVQASGFRALTAMLKNFTPGKNAAIKTPALAILSARGGVETMVRSLEYHRSRGNVVGAALDTLSSLLQEEKSAGATLKKGNATQAVIQGVYTQQFLAAMGDVQASGAMGGSFDANVRNIVSGLVDKADATKAAKGCGDTATLGKDPEVFESSAAAACVYAREPSMAAAMAQAGLVANLVGAYKQLTDKQGIPMQGQMMAAASLAVEAQARAGPEHMQAMQRAGASRALIEAIKKHGKLTEAAVTAMRSVRVFAGSSDGRKALVDDGLIEACVGAMRSDSENAALGLAAMDCMLALASSDQACAALAFQGGTRQAIKMVMDSSSSALFERPTERALQLLDRVAAAKTDDEVKKNLVKQGAVECVTQAMESFPENEQIEAVGARLLSRLLDAKDVETEIAKMAALVKELKASSRPEEVLPKLARSMATVGALALVKENAPVMERGGAAAIIVEALNHMSKLAESKERELGRRAGFRALGQIASLQVLPDNLGVVELILQSLAAPESKFTLREKVGVLNCIKSMAEQRPAADALVKAGVVAAIRKLVDGNLHAEQLATAALGALASLAQHKSGATECTSKGCVKLGLQLMRNNIEQWGFLFAEESMTLLANLALLGGGSNVNEMIDQNVVDLTLQALEAHCSNPAQPEVDVLTAAVTLLQRVSDSEAHVKLLVRRGALDKVISLGNQQTSYLADPECAEAVLFLIESAALVKDTHASLLKSGAVELIMTAMRLNPTNESVLMTGSKALQALLGGGSSDNVKVLLSDVAKLTAQLKKDPEDRNTQQALLHALTNLGNLALVDGVVTSKNAGDLAKTATDTLEVVQGSMKPGPSKNDLLVAAMQIIGRAANVPGAKIDSDAAIRRLLAVIRENAGNDAVLESAMYALGNLLTGPDALRTLADGGGIALLEKTMAESGDNEKLREAASKALDKARAIAAQSAGELAKDSKGVNALADLVLAHANMDAQLRKLLQDIAQNGKSGAGSLLAVLGSDAFKRASPETRHAVLKALNEELSRTKSALKVTSLEDMLGLLAALDESTAGLNKQDADAVLQRQMEAVSLLGKLDPASAGLLAQAGGLKKLLDMLNSNIDNPEVVRAVLQALNRAAADAKVAQQLADMDAGPAVAAAMKKHPDDEKVQEEAINLLAKLAAAKGVGKIGLDAEAMRLINRVVDNFKNNRDIQKQGGKLLDGLGAIYKEEGANMIASRLEASLLKLKAADHIKVMYDEKGRPYYYNEKTKQTTWDMPEELKDSLAALAALSKLTAAHKDNVQVVDPKALAAAVAHLKLHADEPGRLTDLAKMLGVLAINEQNRDAIAKAGGLEAILAALNGKNVDPEFLAAAIHLLNQFARNDLFKDQIAKLGGIEALILIMLKFIDHLQVVEKCMSTLANLAYNSKKNMGEIIKYNGPDAVTQCMRKYPAEVPMLNFAMILLSNLMFGSNDNKLIVGRKCGKEIVDVTRRHNKEPKLFKASLRALGNLSYCDENIVWIVTNGATKAIVAGMDSNQQDIETLQVAIEVIGNFASLDEESDPNVKRRIERGEQQSVYDIIVLEGGAKRIMDAVKQTEEPTIMMAGLEALGNLSHNVVITDKLIGMGIVELVFKAMLKYDWDEAMLERAVRLVAILTYSQDGVRAIREQNGVQIILNAMESHEDQPEFLANAAAALKNIASDDNLREEIGKLGGVQSCLSLMERNYEAMPFLLEVVSLFIRLTRNEQLSVDIAQKGMNIVLEAIGVYKNEISFLVPAFTLIGHLAFAEENLKVIVQYGGIDLIVDTILAHPDSKNLVIRCIQTLDNIAMHSPEQSKIVIAAGGEQTIKEVIAAYSSDKEVAQVGKSALLSMQPQVQRKPAKPKYAFTNEAGQGFTPSTDDPLKDYRNLLKTGVVLTHWSKAGPVSRHFYLKPDMKHLCWRDPNKSSKTESDINVRDVRNVRSGLHDGHKYGRKTANSELAFSIIGRATNLDLEARTIIDRERWVEALMALISTYRNEPHWLR